LDLAGPALLIGLARSSTALAKFFATRGIRMRVCDKKPESELTAFLEQLPGGVDTVFGGYDDRVLDGMAAVYPSPGVWWDDPLLQEARSRGLHVSSEMDLFFRLCPAPIVGVTGTNGKTTTTTLVGRVLARGPKPVLVGGNLGETVIDRLDQVTPDHRVVLEVSSQQLETIAQPVTEVGVVTNVTGDHLDRHGTLERYIEIKARLPEHVRADGWAVLNGADAVCRTFADRTRAQVVWFDALPEQPITLPGAHNRANAKAAAAVGQVLGVAPAAIGEAIATFEGVEHRLELVGEWGGVRWYNDSIATNPVAATTGLKAFDGVPLVLIAGGRGGGTDIGAWVQEVRRRTSAVVAIGESAPEIRRRLEGHRVVMARDLEDAVATAAQLAEPGSAVLLSPAHKSFDMFRDFEDRGRRFKAAVRELHGG
jgi:UDP-N-acetylmuramoylalanine--D-glutamate ligase